MCLQNVDQRGKNQWNKELKTNRSAVRGWRSLLSFNLNLISFSASDLDKARFGQLNKLL